MAKVSGTALYYQFSAYVLFHCNFCIYNCIFKKRGPSIRHSSPSFFFYIIQVCLGRWLKKCRKNKNYFGLDIIFNFFWRKSLLLYEGCALIVRFNFQLGKKVAFLTHKTHAGTNCKCARLMWGTLCSHCRM
jgi:hypothetical protein